MKLDVLFETSSNATCRLSLKTFKLRSTQNFRFLGNSKHDIVVVMLVNSNETLRFI